MEAQAVRPSRRSFGRAHAASTLVLAATLAGCATVRTVPPPATVAVPAAWNATGGGAGSVTGTVTGQTTIVDLSTWWQRLGDATLSSLIEQALVASPDMRTAQIRLRESRAQRSLTDANRYPSVSASGSARGNRSGSQGTTTGSYSASLDASWEPDVFGAARYGLKAADADLRATAADLDGVRVSLSAEVALGYVDVRSYQTRLDIARRNLASQAETLQLTEWREQAGLVSAVDVAQARTNLEQTRSQIPSLEANLEQSKNALAILLGLPPGALDERLRTPAPVPAAPAQIEVGIPADTLRQRPDVRAAEMRLLAETARLGQTRATRFPTFGLSGSVGVDVISAVASSGASTAASLAASVAQKVFDAGRVRRQIEIQTAVQERALVSYESSILTALQDVENALLSLVKNRERESALAKAAESAQVAVELARNRYAAGLADFQTVLDTERTALSIDDSLALSRAEGTSAVIRLYKALGGGWSPNAAAVTTAAGPES